MCLPIRVSNTLAFGNQARIWGGGGPQAIHQQRASLPSGTVAAHVQAKNGRQFEHGVHAHLPFLKSGLDNNYS